MTPLELSRRWIITGFIFMPIIALAAFLGLDPSVDLEPESDLVDLEPESDLLETLLYNLQGDLVELPSDQAKVIHLWRGDCELCLGDMALLERVATSGQYPNLSFYFVNTGDDLARVRALSEGEPWAQRVLSDESGRLVELSTTLPATLFFSAEGELRFSEGALTPETAFGIGVLERYLEGISD